MPLELLERPALEGLDDIRVRGIRQYYVTPLVEQLGFLQISRPALGIAGGLVLFLISLRMIFPVPGGMFGPTPEGEPFIVPIAIPLIAGPSAIATVMLFATRNRALWEWVVAILGAWAVSTLILLASTFLRRVLRRRGLIAIERLMGMILLTVAVQMLLSEISGLFAR